MLLRVEKCEPTSDQDGWSEYRHQGWTQRPLCPCNLWPRPVARSCRSRPWLRGSNATARWTWGRRGSGTRFVVWQVDCSHWRTWNKKIIVSINRGWANIPGNSLEPGPLSTYSYLAKGIVACCRKLNNMTIFCEFIYSDKLANPQVNHNCLIFWLHSCARGRMQVLF